MVHETVRSFIRSERVFDEESLCPPQGAGNVNRMNHMLVTARTAEPEAVIAIAVMPLGSACLMPLKVRPMSIFVTVEFWHRADNSDEQTEDVAHICNPLSPGLVVRCASRLSAGVDSATECGIDIVCRDADFEPRRVVMAFDGCVGSWDAFLCESVRAEGQGGLASLELTEVPVLRIEEVSLESESSAVEVEGSSHVVDVEDDVTKLHCVSSPDSLSVMAEASPQVNPCIGVPVRLEGFGHSEIWLGW